MYNYPSCLGPRDKISSRAVYRPSEKYICTERTPCNFLYLTINIEVKAREI